MGVAEAVTWPSIYALYSQWVSDTRRATAVGFMNSGVAGGSVIALVATPLDHSGLFLAACLLYLRSDWNRFGFLYGTPTTRSSPAGTANASRDEHCGAKSDFPKITLVGVITVSGCMGHRSRSHVLELDHISNAFLAAYIYQ